MDRKHSLSLEVLVSIKTHIKTKISLPTHFILYKRSLAFLPMRRGSIEIRNANHAHVSDEQTSHNHYREKHACT